MARTPLDKLREWKHSPLLFVTEAIRATPSSQQADALRRFPKTKRMSIRSGHGTGKDAFASWIILWFVVTRPFAKVACTAPTGRQLADILWAELSKWMRKSIFADEFVIQSDKIFHKDAPKEHWIRAISASIKATADEQAETLAGLHGDHLLIVVDEASGVPDPVFVPLEGAMTQQDNRCLLIGNMTKNKGYFYDTHFHDKIKAAWTLLHWDSRESTNVSPDMPIYFKNKYGEDSNIFRIRVAGEPPSSDVDSFIQLDWAQQCIGNEIETDPEAPFYLGVDVARYGDDDSVILPRQGYMIHPWESFQKMNTIDLAGHILVAYNELAAAGIAIDEIGVGAGAVDFLTKRPSLSGGRLPIYGVNVANSSSNDRRWHRLRDELWWAVRENCINMKYCFPSGDIGEELCNELASPRYSFDANAAYVVESKKSMRLRQVASPNIADALCMSEYFHNIAHSIFPTGKAQYRRATSTSKIYTPTHSFHRGQYSRRPSSRWQAV